MRRRPHVLLCWEQGSSLGHVAAFGQVSRVLVAAGLRVSAVLQRLHDAEAWFPAEVQLYQAPLVEPVPQPRASSSTYANVLLGAGFGRPASLRPVVSAWSNLFRLLEPDAVVFNMAPTASLAAWGLDIPKAQLGSPWTVPPAVEPWPLLEWWGPDEPGVREASQQRLLQAANAARPHGTPPLSQASDLFAGQRALLLGPELLDPWRLLRAGPVLHLGTMAQLDQGIEVDWPAGEGPRAVGYLKAPYPHNQRILRALERRGVRTLVYVAGPSRLRVDPSRTRVVSEPMRLDRLLPRADLGFTHSALTTGCAMLQALLPTMVFPMQQEQLATARTATARLKGMMALPPPAVPEQLEAALDIALGDAFRQAAETQGEALRDERAAVEVAAEAIAGLISS